MSSSLRRLFFALWPDDTIRAEIVRRRNALRRVSRRRVPDANLHMTLLFLGDLPADRVESVIETAGQVRGEQCRLRLDRLGWFARARVVWLGGEAPAALEGLVDAIEASLKEPGLHFDARPFRPHVTLYRNVLRRPRLPEVEPLDWPVDSFSLVESVPGEPYRVLESWAL